MCLSDDSSICVFADVIGRTQFVPMVDTVGNQHVISK